MAVALLGLSGLIGGCFGDGTPTIAPVDAVYFEATYQNASTVMHVRLDGPFSVLGSEMTEQQAWRLTLEGNETSRYWLDPEYRVGRRDFLCSPPLGDCSYVHADWSLAGIPAPYGIGLLEAVRSGTAWSVGPTPLTVDAEVSPGRDGFVVRVAMDDWMLTGAPYVHDAQMSFRDGELAPFLIHFPGGLQPMERTAYSTGALLPDADPWIPIGRAPPEHPREGPLFPDAQTVKWDDGYTLAEAAERLQELVPEAGVAPGTGRCFLQAESHRPEEQPGNVLAVPLPGEVVARFFLRVGHADGSVNYQVQAVRDNTTGEVTWGVADETSSPYSCALAASPWPAEHLEEVWERVKELPVSGVELGFGWNILDEGAYPGGPERGVDEYRFTYTPAAPDLKGAQVMLPYAVGYSANHGGLEWARVHPSDLSRWGQRGS